MSPPSFRPAAAVDAGVAVAVDAGVAVADGCAVDGVVPVEQAGSTVVPTFESVPFRGLEIANGIARFAVVAAVGCRAMMMSRDDFVPQRLHGSHHRG